MKLSGSRAEKFLKSPAPDSLGVLLFGPDRGLARERADIAAKAYLPEADADFGLTILTADDIAQDPARLADEMAAMSLLGDERLIRLKLEHEKSGAAISKIIREIDSNPDRASAKLVIEAGDMTPRSAIRKAFEGAKHFTAIGCYADTQATLANLVRTEFETLGIAIERDALAAWTPLLEGDRGLARGEIEKMALYKGYGQDAGATVTVQDVQDVAAGAQAASIDDIIYACMSGETQICDDNYRRAMNGKMSPVVILMSLQRHIVRLQNAAAQVDTGQTIDSAMRGLRPPVFAMRQSGFGQHLRLWGVRPLGKALTQSLETEKAVKSAGAPTENLVGRLLIALSTFAGRRRR